MLTNVITIKHRFNLLFLPIYVNMYITVPSSLEDVNMVG